MMFLKHSLCQDKRKFHQSRVGFNDVFYNWFVTNVKQSRSISNL